jgi:ferredoxin-NADP reductase
MNARFVRKEEVGPDIWELFFRPDGRLDYQAGQYVDVQLMNVVDSRGPSRTLSLTSLPTDELLSFAVKFPSPHSVYKSRLLELSVDDEVSISQAMGDLVLPRDMTRALVFVAGGLGIASFVAMMKHMGNEASPRDITLLYAHKPDEKLFVDVMKSCPGLKLTEFVSPQRLGISDIVQDDANTLYYISGSEPFTMQFRDQLLDASVPPTNIVYDYFDGYQTTDL